MATRIIYDAAGREIKREEYDQMLLPTAVADIKAEAARRISVLFGGKTGQSLIYAEINALSDGSYPASAVQAIRVASDAIEARLALDPYLDPATQPEWP
ncbi:MAG: hypothetical protein HQL44_17150 [Alphaproteobacteria bacterium]|nr:hypothetical protein [Alphaproteobacteria bacterium]